MTKSKTSKRCECNHPQKNHKHSRGPCHTVSTKWINNSRTITHDLCLCLKFTQSFEQLVQLAQDQHRKQLADELDEILLQIKAKHELDNN